MKEKSPALVPWASLRFRDFRLLEIGMLLSNIGSRMQMAAIGWHLWKLTGSELALGMIGLVTIVPIIVLSLFGGAVADAMDRRRVLVVTNSAMAIFATILGIVTLAGVVQPWMIYLLAALISAAVPFDNPARSALIPRLVPENYLTNALSVGVIVFQISMMIGPVLAGLIIAVASPGAVYVINAISFGAVIAAVLMMETSGAVEGNQKVNAQAVWDGIAFVRRTPLMWGTMVLDFMVMFFGAATALLPVFATEVYQVDAQGYGVLAAAFAIGSTIGSITTAWIGMRLRRTGWVLLASVMLYGTATILFGLSTSFWIGFIALALTGVGDSISTVLRNTIRQLVTPDSLRGRMTGINMIFFMGGPQLGELEAGIAASLLGAPLSVVIGGVGAVVSTVVVGSLVPHLRAYDQSVDAVFKREGISAPAEPPLQPAATESV